MNRSKRSVLSPFRPEHAREVAGWLVDVDEARAWGGRNTPFPPDSGVFSDWHHDPDVHPFVGLIDDELVAYGEIWSDDAAQEIELARIIVSPSRRRSGIGRAFVTSLLEEAAAFRFPRAFVRVVPENAPAIACYEKAGFVRVSSDDQDRFNERQPLDYLWLTFQINSMSCGVRMITIRSEQTGDAEAIREINLRAFGGSDEADLVDALRQSCSDAMSLAAVNDGRLIGHILFTPVVIQGSNQQTAGTGLAPMSVLPEFQRRGVGTKLIEAGLEALGAAGAPFVVVLGHPRYYPRFGFRPASECQLTCEFDVPDEMFMVLPLATESGDLAGVARYRQEFDTFK